MNDVKMVVLAVTVSVFGLFIINSVESCNEAVCASVVSKCMLTQSCKCDLKNCSCCKECFSCLKDHYHECCSCVDMCPKPNDTGNSLSKKSHVEDFPEPIPDLFQALMAEPDTLERWHTFTYPVDFDISMYRPKIENEIKILNQLSLIPTSWVVEELWLRYAFSLKTNSNKVFLNVLLSENQEKSYMGGWWGKSWEKIKQYDLETVWESRGTEKNNFVKSLKMCFKNFRNMKFQQEMKKNNEQEVAPRKDIVTLNCTVAYMSQCMSWNKCKSSCQSTGASKYRWFHDGCCECISHTCINYGINESRCMKCPISKEESQDEKGEYHYDEEDDIDHSIEEKTFKQAQAEAHRMSYSP